MVADVVWPLVRRSLQSIPHGQRQGFLQVVQVLRWHSGWRSDAESTGDATGDTAVATTGWRHTQFGRCCMSCTTTSLRK